MRSFDMVARWGGEEFVVVLPETDGPTALRIAERLVRKVGETPMAVNSAPNGGLTVTVSVGVASTSVEMPGEELIKMADAALYRAKEGGRNQVCADPRRPAGRLRLRPPAIGVATAQRPHQQTCGMSWAARLAHTPSTPGPPRATR